jgi:hypothetical protein
MKNWCIVHLESGAILQTSSAALISYPEGTFLVEAPLGVTGESHYWDGEIFQEREILSLESPVPCAEPGEEVLLPFPEDAWYMTTFGELNHDNTEIIVAGYKENNFTLVGQYRGSITVEVIPAGTSMDKVRSERDKRLYASDIYVISDRPLEPSERTAWEAYRQALRDVPETQPGATLASVVWPTPPQ